MAKNKVFDVAVIGGGIVGTSAAMNLLEKKGLQLAVIEAEPKLAAHQTGNNSGVIHSGLYYKPGSLKAKNCVEGREMMYRFCEEHDIRHERCGKVVVAVSVNEIPALDELEHRGRANGLEGIKRLKREEIKEFEPHAAGIDGLFVPETGIVDYTQVTEAYGRIIQERGGEILTGRKFLLLKKDGSDLIIQTDGGELSA